MQELPPAFFILWAYQSNNLKFTACTLSCNGNKWQGHE